MNLIGWALIFGLVVNVVSIVFVRSSQYYANGEEVMNLGGIPLHVVKPTLSYDIYIPEGVTIDEASKQWQQPYPYNRIVLFYLFQIN